MYKRLSMHTVSVKFGRRKETHKTKANRIRRLEGVCVCVCVCVCTGLNHKLAVNFARAIVVFRSCFSDAVFL